MQIANQSASHPCATATINEVVVKSNVQLGYSQWFPLAQDVAFNIFVQEIGNVCFA